MSKSYPDRGAVYSNKANKAGFIVSLLAVCALCCAPPAVNAQDAPTAQQHDPAAIYIAAGADKDTVTKIRQLAADFETKARTNYKTLMTSVGDMQKLSLEPNLDEDKILATQDSINRITADMANDRIKLLVSSRKLLKPEQRDKLVELLKQRRAQQGQAPGLPQ